MISSTTEREPRFLGAKLGAMLGLRVSQMLEDWERLILYTYLGGGFKYF